MIRYAIGSGQTDAGTTALATQAERLAREGVDYFQIREKHLSFPAAVALAAEVQHAVRRTPMCVLLNMHWTPSSEVAWPENVGIHLSSASLQAFPQQGGDRRQGPVSASCHTVAEAIEAARFADLLLFAPVFEKRVSGAIVSRGSGLEMLREVTAVVAPVPVLAMGGVTLQNATACMEAGAAGIAGIRLFARAAE